MPTQKIDLGNLYKTQVSLTEWFEKLKHEKTADLRIEDNDKRERLNELNKIISLPFDKPTQFQAIDISENTNEFKKFFSKHKNELCALRLIPLSPDLPKLRLRGITIEKALDWFKEQNINPKEFKADFVPHGDSQKWSTIFIVNKNGIFGEIIKGGHYQLTQGFYDLGKPISFFYDFKKLTLSKKRVVLEKYLKNIFHYLLVKDEKKQSILKRKFKSKFYNNYLAGYFETVDTKEFGLWFIDYNRILGNIYENHLPMELKENLPKNIIKGLIACHGKVKGKVRIISSKNIEKAYIEKGEILVCDMTTPDFLPLMRKAIGIITDFGGMLSHAAIISRELNIPCITATSNATVVLNDGDEIEIDTRSECIIAIQTSKHPKKP